MTEGDAKLEAVNRLGHRGGRWRCCFLDPMPPAASTAALVVSSTTSSTSTSGFRRRALNPTPRLPPRLPPRDSMAPPGGCPSLRPWWWVWRTTVGKKGECRVGVLDELGTAALKRHWWHWMLARSPKRRHWSDLAMRRAAEKAANARAKRRGGAAEGQAARPAFGQHRSRSLSRCHAGPRSTRKDTGGQRACPCWRIGDPNLVDRCVGLDASDQIRRTAEACATGRWWHNFKYGSQAWKLEEN
jgi:hypothetical protein